MKLQPTATHSPLQTQRGFSLVEVTLAVGIAAFGLAALMGLIPTGLSQFRDAKNVTVSSQIAQRLLKEAAATDYETLLGVSAGTSTPTSLVEKEVRYFDDEGIELKTSDGNPQASAIFHTYMRVLPKTLLPDSSGGALPKSNMLATVTVQLSLIHI